MSNGSRLVFVSGAPRSGTTLVQNMLDSHPRIVGAPEFPYVRALMRTRDRMHHDIDRGRIASVCSKPSADARFAELIEGLLLPLLDQSDEATLVSEKTPENILAFPQLLVVFPAARFVHVVRDPRGVVTSLLQVGDRMRQKGMTPNPYTRNMSGAINHVRECLHAGFEASRSDPARVLTLRYEDVVSDPAAEARRLCCHLGVDWRPEMVTPSRFRHLAEAAITESSGNVWYTRQTFNQDPDPSRTHRWQHLLAPRDQARICRAFEDDAAVASLGYDLSTTGHPRRVHLRASLSHGLADGAYRAARSRPARRVRALLGL